MFILQLNKLKIYFQFFLVLFILSCSPLKPKNIEISHEPLSVGTVENFPLMDEFIMEFGSAQNVFFLWKEDLSAEKMQMVLRASDEYERLVKEVELFEIFKIMPLREDLSRLRLPHRKLIEEEKSQLANIVREHRALVNELRALERIKPEDRTEDQNKKIIELNEKIPQMEEKKLLSENKIRELEVKETEIGKDIQQKIDELLVEKSTLVQKAQAQVLVIHQNADLYHGVPSVVFQALGKNEFHGEGPVFDIYFYSWNLEFDREDPKDFSTQDGQIFDVKYSEFGGRLQFTVDLENNEFAYFDIHRSGYAGKGSLSGNVIFRGQLEILKKNGQKRFGKVKLVGKSST